MKTRWNDKMGHRGRNARCVVVTADGAVHDFTGASIPGVCHSANVGGERNGKWSNTTWEITHAETTAVVEWHDDWDSGRAWPQSDWDSGFYWLASQAPLLLREKFEVFVRARYVPVAERWDAARKATEEFGFSATPAEIAAIAAAQARIAAEKAAYEAAEKERRANSPFAVLLTRRSAE